ncbi:AmmeMemoRadiSam system protein B [uncultured Pseudodesulfovibrio sp.]|uniref:AmmeMemoRadiSam system protein B n=1 Tax=uncultured Pseudodesulfovibrio sp. TaxID=2035858 RepID=UPI0029C94921|nr:AmmeMemoRadiSam system protein B [uncultured Pseudodesulfovibrio sp.]
MDRQPTVAGRFYDEQPDRLYALVDKLLGLTEGRQKGRTLLSMVPHAGYVFSGAVCGKTLGSANLESTVLLLGPNHTGRGGAFALWPDGSWIIPGGAVPIDTELAQALLDADPDIKADTSAHMGEHSIEVVLPFLYRLNPETTIVPICISAPLLDSLERVGKAIGRTLKEFGRPVSIVVSSDMSHYISNEEAREKDGIALEPVMTLDPASLYDTVRVRHISMCGVLPMTTGLFAANTMGATHAELVAYATSGEVSGDFEQVVGYAGIVVD